ncbi:hypothetical protein [Sphaerochaeta sp. PS]|uniref:hypothetical protein n=1 Tax=Sphaerochaeta sp. PS TaxID=3076336 RepID=UPI0028A36D22|nr:hypothetical protein [Sphaerochaeta sp. PS]MDT4762574.1 hypothetical protein [Sphaerochaeta sp. PS]
MKKTIAILLVLVLAGVGLFAADKTLQLTTTVATLNEFKVTRTPIDAGDVNDFSKFTALLTRTTLGVDRTSTLDGAAYLTVANNSTTAYSIGLKAGKLAAEGIKTEIGYTVTCGDAVGVEALSTSSVAGSTTFTEALSVTGDVNNGVNIASKAISVAIVTNDFDSAGAGNYVGLIYFNITAV